ncbi:MAG TPA: PIN domain-containing protein [Terriglobales bacterium]|nr:PIN domain-containing protein [Terriglobales bacterium]
MNASKMAVFPDTNLFLHYRSLSEIDWCSLLRSSTVEIEIAPVVPRELEKQKTLNPSKKLRDRAATALKLLHKHLTNPQVRDGVTLQFLIKEPTSEFAASRGLSLQLEDDRLIGTFFLYRDENPETRCVLVTGDLPLTIKAHQFQIEFLSLDESLLLPAEPDPLEKKNKELAAELNRYKSREPLLAVVFGDYENHARFQLPSPANITDSEPEIQAKLAAVKEKVQPVELRPKQELDPASIANNPILQVAESIRQTMEGVESFGRQFHENYNVQVAAYYRAYERYLRDNEKFKTLALRTIELNLIVVNSGTCPAEDIYVSLHFPDGFMLYDEKHPPKMPEEPAAPSKEMNLFPHSSLLSSLPYMPDIRARFPQPRDPSVPKIRKTNSYNVEFEHEKLQHGFIWTFAPLYVAFDSWELAKSFSIDYVIRAANMIDAEEGALGVVVENGQ